MKLLCLGDSLTYGYDVPPSESWTARTSARLSLEIVNEGICGDTTANMYYRLQQVKLDRYDAFFFMGGSNDILLDYPLADIYKNISQIGSCLKAAGKPVYLGVPPLTKPESAWYGWQEEKDVTRHNEQLRQYRHWLQNYAKEEGFSLIDFYQALEKAEKNTAEKLYADGVHPNKKGYAVLARAACRVLKK